VRTYDGRPVRLDEALGTGWSLLGVGVDPRAVLGPGVASWERVGTTFATVHRAGERPRGQVGERVRALDSVDLEDTSGELTTWLRRAGARHGSVLALRPDRFVFGIAHGGSDQLTRALVAQLGLDDRRSAEPGRLVSGAS
jgi:3-(3-hydroxy-phenyl)propionate hydroxylase